MAFEPEYDTVRSDGYTALSTGQAVVEARLLPKPQVKIAKVLSTAASVDVTAAECFTSEARYSGRVNFKVLFESEDGGVDVLDYNADFSDKIVHEGITASSKTHFEAEILDMDIVTAEADVIKLAAVVEAKLYVSESAEVKYLSGGAEGLYVQKDRVPVCVMSGEAHETFIISDTVATDEGEVISCEAEIVTLSRSCDEDSINLEGQAHVNLVMKDGSGTLRAKRITIPVQQQCRASGVNAGDTLIGCMSLKNVSVTAVEATSGEQGAAVEIELTVSADCTAYRKDEITPVTDAFCLENELLLTVQSVACKMPCGDITLSDRIDGTVEIDDKLPLVDNILGVCGARVQGASVSALGGKVTVNGMLRCNIIYYNAAEGSSNTVLAQVPFSSTLSCNDIQEGDKVSVKTVVKDVDVKILRGNSLGIKADVCFMVTPIRECVTAVISEVGIGEKKPVRSAAITVHIARKNETLWEAAKALGITPEEVSGQNSDCTFPCSGGERLIAYRRLSK